ncbi:Uncharacterized protein APZ42_024136 [Daphnia magna]|uniref:Uncharacterized protein n=1 Tax=Daphnia magna TaxID=35525 RepID=A0A164UGP5_9CRUS|nr:Uncharacterized protein APZ42_024136 [Daphnia magna]
MGSCFRSLELPRSAKASCLRSVRQQSDYFKNFRVGCSLIPAETLPKRTSPSSECYSFYVLLDAICSSLLVIG